MQVQAGAETKMDGEYECVRCHSEIKVLKGERVPRCEKCGGELFEFKREVGGRMTMSRGN